MECSIVCDSCDSQVFRDSLIEARTAAMRAGWKFHPVLNSQTPFVVCDECTDYYRDRRRQARLAA